MAGLIASSRRHRLERSCVQNTFLVGRHAAWSRCRQLVDRYIKGGNAVSVQWNGTDAEWLNQTNYDMQDHDMLKWEASVRGRAKRRRNVMLLG